MAARVCPLAHAWPRSPRTASSPAAPTTASRPACSERWGPCWSVPRAGWCWLPRQLGHALSAVAPVTREPGLAERQLPRAAIAARQPAPPDTPAHVAGANVPEARVSKPCPLGRAPGAAWPGIAMAAMPDLAVNSSRSRLQSKAQIQAAGALGRALRTAAMRAATFGLLAVALAVTANVSQRAVAGRAAAATAQGACFAGRASEAAAREQWPAPLHAPHRSPRRRPSRP